MVKRTLGNGSTAVWFSINLTYRETCGFVVGPVGPLLSQRGDASDEQYDRAQYQVDDVLDILGLFAVEVILQPNAPLDTTQQPRPSCKPSVFSKVE